MARHTDVRRERKTTIARTMATARPPNRSTAARSRKGRAPALTKDELRTRIGKLERANATLRARNKTLRDGAARVADRIGQLEVELDRLQRQLEVESAGLRDVDRSDFRETEDEPWDDATLGIAPQEASEGDGAPQQEHTR